MNKKNKISNQACNTGLSDIIYLSDMDDYVELSV